MIRYELTSEMKSGIKNVKNYDLSMIDFAHEHGIIMIKDFSDIPIEKRPIPFNDTYLIVFQDGTYAFFTCAEEALNKFIQELL
ncbi:MAG: hypothetical protein IJK93_09870 [Muribaculaceae bacterium]|nr:hypothetical protein [Muribaculaceae bacterium]